MKYKISKSKISRSKYLRKISSRTILQNLKQSKKSGEEFKTQLFLKKNNNQIVEGGLRLRGFFKYNRNTEPLITIITVVFNNKKKLEDTIKSIKGQNYKNLEYIIIDGGSTDGTLDIIKKYNNFIDYWVSEKDNGIYDAMNKGCRLALGAGLVFLNSGDIFVGNIFNSKIKLPCLIPCKIKGIKKNIFFRKITDEKCGMPTSHQAMIFANKKKLYDLSYKISSDYDYYLRNDTFTSLNLNCLGYVLYDNSGVSRINWLRRDIETMIIIFKNFGLLKVIKFLFKRIYVWNNWNYRL
jgi:putative colanic acid biosynthesis glycosyltransferase